MGRTQHSLLIVLWILINPLCYSQSPVKVSDPILEMNGNIITISYEILNVSFLIETEILLLWDHQFQFRWL